MLLKAPGLAEKVGVRARGGTCGMFLQEAAVVELPWPADPLLS